MLKRSIFFMALVVTLLAVMTVGCKTSSKKVVFKVQVDGRSDQFVGAFLAYFPRDVKVHPGDEIDFDSIFNGEPHTVTLGKNVDAVFDLVAQACPTGLNDPACAEGPPAEYADQYFALDAKLPQFFPEGEGDVIQASAQPCYLAIGDPPADGSACTADQQKQPDFDGTQTYYNSGFLPEGAVFKVQLAKNIAPGTYDYYCLLHREGMSGRIEVVAKDTKIPSADEAKKAGDAEFDTMVTALKPTADQLDTFTAGTAQAGAFSETVQEAMVNEFGPKTINIAEGASVTWTVMGLHTISFNTPNDAQTLLTKGDDGGYHINQKAVEPSNSPQPGEPDPDASSDQPILVDASMWNGDTFLSSGVLESFGQPTYQYKVTFAKAGKYSAVCIIHPGMGVTVNVGQ